MTFDAIADWLNKEGYLTVRGKKFRGAHIHSILKKRLAKEELLGRQYPPIWSDFSMEVVDKTLVNMLLISIYFVFTIIQHFDYMKLC